MTFKDDESVELLLAMELKHKGQRLKLSRARKPKPKSNFASYVKGATKIFVGAIPNKVTLDEFREYFEQYGPIDDVCLPMKSKAKGINRGHGFINYVYPLSAKLAVEQYAEHYLRAKWVDVKLANPRTDTSPNFKAFRTDSLPTTAMQSDCSPVDAYESSSKLPSSRNSDFTSPVDASTLIAHSAKTNYFSLGNTLNADSKTQYTDRLDNWMNRFSFQLYNNAKINAESEPSRSRFSFHAKERPVMSYKCLEKLERQK